VHFFELRLNELPSLRLDNREIIAARLACPSELGNMAVTGPVAAYFDRRFALAPVADGPAAASTAPSPRATSRRD
jgi:hypothetical protein